MNALITLGLLILAGYSKVVTATNNPPPSETVTVEQAKNPQESLRSGDKTAPFRLEVSQRLLSDALAELAAKFGTSIHSETLPKMVLTANCVGDSVAELVQCLLGGRLDFVLKSPASGSSGADTAQLHHLPELWILPTKMNIDTAAISPKTTLANAKAGAAGRDHQQLVETLKEAGSTNAEQRANAIYNLGLSGNRDNPEIKETLRIALRDQNANVRAQAKAAIQQRGDEDLIAEAAQAEADAGFNPGAAEEESKALQQAALLRQASKLNEASALKLMKAYDDEAYGGQ